MAPQTSLFQVFLRLRPPMQQNSTKVPTEPWLLVEQPTPKIQDNEEQIQKSHPTHITLQPPNDSRKRAIERFGFTKVFHEEASQLDVFEEIAAVENIHNVLKNGRDGLIATLGVTGSGKSHTILGTKSQRGLTQMSLDVLYRSIGSNIRRPCHPDLPTDTQLLESLQASDPSDAHIFPATTFLENIYTDGDRARFSRAQTPMAGIGSRAQTPLMVGPPSAVPGSFPMSPGPSVPSSARDSFATARSSFASDATIRSPQSTRLPQPRRLCRPLGKHTTAVHDQPLPTVEEDAPQREPWHLPSKANVWERFSPKRKHAKKSLIQDSFPMHNARKPPMPRPSTFAHEPDMASYATHIDPQCDYVVLVSMYEVYNDRIFDLLSSTPSSGPAMSTRQGAALQKGLMRRPLLFKNTEMSDRKVVAGLKKVVCSNYDEAMMVLETGLTERRVAGTGSNSVSSRSHGFFCIEVKKKVRGNDYAGHHLNQWSGGTLSIVDLAGSERARNAKTTGSTLAEAGKINESLMYLGQCLQVQSDCQQHGTKPIVPFRQCKLTELLFSNSFPSSNDPSHSRPPQKAVMIVTADPSGDFNATSQILRYSALAREVTVPRIPSVTEAMGALKPAGHSGRNTPMDMPQNYFSAQELEQARHEIDRLAEECNALVVRLTEEEIKRTEAELRLQASEEQAAVREQEVREECWEEMETMLEKEKERWRAALDEERINSQEYMDEKIEILEKNVSFDIHEDQDPNGRVDELERENEVLRGKLAALEQEMQTRSPTKKKTAPKTPGKKTSKVVLEETTSTNIIQNPFLASLREMEKQTIVLQPSSNSDEEAVRLSEISPRKLTLRGSSVRASAMTSSSQEEILLPQTPGTTKKKTRKLTTRKWEVDDDIF
ncbi:hypothetical protein OHC33_008455 [Knufia fluminis]|uniref:Kinesin-like protein n=1 Tax=Knufia fluminis TaxID=191047 RepID=A0AAN8IJT0_9EURO|nr:hypothetical protein OHC33_008455 [Knufia fluminis]